MAPGIRILAMDGAGTRCLSSLYALRQIMDLIVPGQGGSVRPAEYFDLIGSSGPNGLAALLFTKFAFSIDEALAYFYEFASRLDNVDEVFRTKQGEEMTIEEWDILEKKSPEPELQLETVRRNVLSNTWSELICREITDWFERSTHIENGKFNFKSPEAYVGVGRCRAAVMGSEAPGFGPNGGIDKNRMYHAPRWHRTYRRRHITVSQYTFYAIALGTCAFPGIISNGLLFPDLAAPGTHIEHNPVELLLEECGKLFPGLPASLILSIGAGNAVKPSPWDHSRPHGRKAAEASVKISQSAEMSAQHIQKYVIPHHRMYQNAYFRFNVSSDLPLFESEAKEEILDKTRKYLEDGKVATQAQQVAALLEDDSFPSEWEDHVAIASLAFLCTSLCSSGHNIEAEMVSDALSSFILYEPTKNDAGTHRKLALATAANRLTGRVRRESQWNREAQQGCPIDYLLNSMMAYGEAPDLRMEGYGANDAIQMNSLSDITAAVYYVLTKVSSEGQDAHKSYLFPPTLRQIASLVSMPAEITATLIQRLEEVLAIASIASVCEAAYLEYLTAEPRLLLSGPFIRHLTTLLFETDLSKLSVRLLDPIANSISGIIHLAKWSPIRDALVLRLLESYGDQKVDWALVNLAVEWQAKHTVSQDVERTDSTTECARLCQKWLDECKKAYAMHRGNVAILSVRQGYLGLLRKALEGDELETRPRTDPIKPVAEAITLLNSAITANGENLLHLSGRAAFIPVTKMVVEALGRVQSKPFLAAKDSGGYCPLHLACRGRGDFESFLLFLYGGADINELDARGQTALYMCFPPKAETHDYVPTLDRLATEHGLLLTLPLKSFQAWGNYNNGRTVDTPTFVLRRLINCFVANKCSVDVKDLQGRTSAHYAAVNGWGINIDALFKGSGAETEEKIRLMLLASDDLGDDILSTARKHNDETCEAIIVSEMRKRCLDIPLKATSETQLLDECNKPPVNTIQHIIQSNPSEHVQPAMPNTKEAPGPKGPGPMITLPPTVSSSRSHSLLTPTSPQSPALSQTSPPNSSHGSMSSPVGRPSPLPSPPQPPYSPPVTYRVAPNEENRKGGKFLKKIFK